MYEEKPTKTENLRKKLRTAATLKLNYKDSLDAKANVDSQSDDEGTE